MTVVQHTPWWVFAVLAVLIVTGAQALRPRAIASWRLLIVPAVFVVWGVVSVVLRSAVAPVLALDWIAAVALGAALGFATTRLDAFAFEAGGQVVSLPGSPLPLVRNGLIFIARYALAVAAAFAATESAHAQIIAWDVAVSGLATGYFLGWLGRAARAWARAIQPAA